MNREERYLVPATRPLLHGWYGLLAWTRAWSNPRWPSGLASDRRWVFPLRPVADNGTVSISVVYGPRRDDFARLSDLAFDTQRADARVRVMSVVADTVRSPRGATSGSACGVSWRVDPGARDLVLYGDGDLRFAAPGHESDDAVVVPELAELDPHNDARLPDGSRELEAFAIAAIGRALLRDEVNNG